MEINITQFFGNALPHLYSASQVELGNNAALITWNNARQADFNFIDTDEKRKAFAQHVCEMGFSEDAFKFSPIELNALFIQLISGDLREACAFDESTNTMDWGQYEKDSAAGQCSGNLFKADDGQVYYQF
jgi:hypothetical protein